MKSSRKCTGDRNWNMASFECIWKIRFPLRVAQNLINHHMVEWLRSMLFHEIAIFTLLFVFSNSSLCDITRKLFFQNYLCLPSPVTSRFRERTYLLRISTINQHEKLIESTKLKLSKTWLIAGKLMEIIETSSIVATSYCTIFICLHTFRRK